MIRGKYEPELSGREFSIRDCARSNQPKRKYPAGQNNACSVGIIGGADGPTAIFLAGRQGIQVHSVCSALHFEPVETVEWKMQETDMLITNPYYDRVKAAEDPEKMLQELE